MKKIFSILKNKWFVLTIIILVGLCLRLSELNDTSFWYDEGFTGDTIKLGWKEMFDVIARDKVHPPLYYVFVKLWSYIFGFTQTGIRSFSVFTGLLTILSSFYLGKEIFDRKKYPVTGLILALVVSISPFFVTYSIEARAYSLIGLVTVLLSLFVFKYISKGFEKKYLVLSILFGLILCFTHYLQMIFVIGLVISSILYVYIYSEKRTNKKFLCIFILVFVLAVILATVFPFREILYSKGIVSSWWIPDVKFTDIFRINYSYLFGVVRYIQGVPPMRDMNVPVPELVIAGCIFFVQLIGFVYLILSKNIERDVKRSVVFFVSLWSISYFGFLYLGLFGINTIVERYTIACGIILLLSHFILLTVLLKKRFVIIPLVIYVIGILLLKPMATSVDYRDVSEEINKLEGVERVIFKYPADYVVTSFYMENDIAYYTYSFEGEYDSWALLTEDKGLKEEEISSGDVFVAQSWEKDNYVSNGYYLMFDSGDFILLEKI